MSKLNNTVTTVADANEANDTKCNRTQIKRLESNQHQNLPTVTLCRPLSKSTGAFSESATGATAVQSNVGSLPTPYDSAVEGLSRGCLTRSGANQGAVGAPFLLTAVTNAL